MSLNTILATAPLTSTGFHLKANGTTLGNSLIWDNGTNVGIGNTNTSYTLDVTGTGRFTGALTGAASTWSGNITIQKTAPNILMKGGYTQDLAFFLNNEPSVYLVDDATATKGIRVNISTGAFTQLGGGASSFSGNVGIGTDSPVTKLDVVANSDATALTLRMRTADNFAFLQFRNNAGTQVISEIYSNRTADNTGSLIFTTNNGGSATERMRITSGGQIVMGRTTPSGSGRLTVDGDLYLHNITSGAGQSTLKYNYTSTGLVTYDTSSRLLKKDIENLGYGLDDVLKMSAKKYKWKRDDSIDLGFIADEMVKIIPEIVFFSTEMTNETTGVPIGEPLSINYDRLIPVLVKAIQEQQIQIQNLQEQINILAK